MVTNVGARVYKQKTMVYSVLLVLELAGIKQKNSGEQVKENRAHYSKCIHAAQHYCHSKREVHSTDIQSFSPAQEKVRDNGQG